MNETEKLKTDEAPTESVLMKLLSQKSYSYSDMIKAFQSGRRHYRDCGDTNNDCWDFATWIKDEFKNVEA